MQCPQCRHENPPDAKFCLECGYNRQAVACPACGTELPAGAKFCKSCGQKVGAGPRAHRGRTGRPGRPTPPGTWPRRFSRPEAALEGERKQVTVLFADLKGSLDLLADRDPEDARKLLDPVVEHMMEAVHRYEGTVEPGDGRRDHGPLRRPAGP